MIFMWTATGTYTRSLTVEALVLVSRLASISISRE